MSEEQNKILTINCDDPYNYYLINCKGDKYYFNPHTTYGEELYDFILPNLISEKNESH